MSDNNRGTHRAPAVATDGAHVAFIRRVRRKEPNLEISPTNRRNDFRAWPAIRSADPLAKSPDPTP